MWHKTCTRWVVVGALLLGGSAACTGGSGGGSASKTTPSGAAATAQFSIDDAATGPAPIIAGARKGGTVTLIEQTDFAHLDPARIYLNYPQNIAGLISRTLTTYRQTPTGKVTLVGDLATSTGKPSDGGKTWTWTLRDNVAWSDGAAITAPQLKYGIERTFAQAYTEGPTYLNEWLAGTPDFRSVYAGPYSGRHLDAVQAPDDKTLVLTFTKPRPDAPFAMALPNAAPVRPARDTKDQYDVMPDASGPYMIASHVVDKSLILTKNPHWDPTSDPARYQFVDGYRFEFGADPLAIDQRLIAAYGADTAAYTLSTSLLPEVLQQVDTTPALKARTTAGLTPFVTQLNINNTRVTDLEVRKALLVSYPRFQTRQIEGGASRGDFADTVLSPTVPGFQAFNLFNTKPEGDPEAAKAILAKAGKTGTRIVYGYGDDPVGQRVAVAVAAALTKAGFTVVKKPIGVKNFFDVIGDPKNALDLYPGGWGSDWPSGATVIPPTMDGRKIGIGSPNYQHFNDPEVNAEMDRISVMTDLTAAAAAWGRLDQLIMSKVPFIPDRYIKVNQIHGAKVAGLYVDKILGEPNLNGVYLTK